MGLPGLRRGDRPLATDEEPPLGAHLVTPRFAYAHHGVYVGAGAVVHYGAFEYHWQRRPVEEVSLAHFAHGRPIWVRPVGADRLRSEEVIRRARSRLGEDRYRLLSNNCEHFSEWCVRGQHRSAQVERLTALPRRLTQALRGLTQRLRRTGPGRESLPLAGRSCMRVLSASSPQAAARAPWPATSVAGLLIQCSCAGVSPSIEPRTCSASS